MKKAPKLCVTKNDVYYVYINRKKVYLGKGSRSVIDVRYKELLRRLLTDDWTDDAPTLRKSMPNVTLRLPQK